MSAYPVLIYSHTLSPAGKYVQSFFDAASASTIPALFEQLKVTEYRALVVDLVLGEEDQLEVCREILNSDSMKDIPLLVLASQYAIEDKLKAFEYGCDDLIDSRIEHDEICARVTKSIFNKIAHSQLSKRLEEATDTARHALDDNGDLGANIQFLLSVHDCDNLDQLGQQFFATIERYGLSCSIQLRSIMGVKDMEAHGMAKDLESQLLMQLKDAERFIDFGARTVLNYDRVSVLIKNMPLGNKEKCDAIKENTFYLVQGLNARVLALEDRYKLLTQRETLRLLTDDIQSGMETIHASYKKAAVQIVVEVENAVEMVQNRLAHLSVSESDRSFIEGVLRQLDAEVRGIGADEGKVTNIFSRLEQRIQRLLKKLGPDAGMR